MGGIHIKLYHAPMHSYSPTVSFWRLTQSLGLLSLKECHVGGENTTTVKLALSWALKKVLIIQVVSVWRSKSVAKLFLGPNQMVLIERWSLDQVVFKTGFTAHAVCVIAQTYFWTPNATCCGFPQLGSYNNSNLREWWVYSYWSQLNTDNLLLYNSLVYHLHCSYNYGSLYNLPATWLFCRCVRVHVWNYVAFISFCVAPGVH